ncbi:MAG: hypothetical protein WD470_11955 [Rhodospirillaceae bacterium]
MKDEHTIAGLLRKRAEIAGQIEHTQAQLNDLIADLDYIDNAIRIIDPDCDATLTRSKPFPPRMGAFRGEMQRFVLAHLRNATEPSTTLEIAYKVMEGRGLDKNDERAVIVIRKRVGACLYKLRRTGVVREVESTGEYKRWEMAG